MKLKPTHRIRVGYGMPMEFYLIDNEWFYMDYEGKLHSSALNDMTSDYVNQFIEEIEDEDHA